MNVHLVVFNRQTLVYAPYTLGGSMSPYRLSEGTTFSFYTGRTHKRPGDLVPGWIYHKHATERFVGDATCVENLWVFVLVSDKLSKIAWLENGWKLVSDLDPHTRGVIEGFHRNWQFGPGKISNSAQAFLDHITK